MSTPCYLVSHGRLRRLQNTLAFERNGSDGSVERSFLPIEALSEVYLMGEIELNTRVLVFLNQHRIPVHVFNYYGYYSGTFMPRKIKPDGTIVIAQVQHYLDEQKRLSIAAEFVGSSLYHIRRTLQYYAQRSSDCTPAIEAVERALQRIGSCQTIAELMQCEGHARRAYYSAFNSFACLTQPYQIRTRRPPKTELDAALSFGNGLLYATVASAVYQTKLDPSIGFLHAPSDRRLSLVLDIAEIFNLFLVERMVFRLINRKQLRPELFERCQDNGGVYLGAEGRALMVTAWNELLSVTVTDPAGQAHSYRRLIERECWALVNHLKGSSPYRALRAWW